MREEEFSHGRNSVSQRRSGNVWRYPGMVGNLDLNHAVVINGTLSR